MQINVKQL